MVLLSSASLFRAHSFGAKFVLSVLFASFSSLPLVGEIGLKRSPPEGQGPSCFIDCSAEGLSSHGHNFIAREVYCHCNTYERQENCENQTENRPQQHHGGTRSFDVRFRSAAWKDVPITHLKSFTCRNVPICSCYCLLFAFPCKHLSHLLLSV